MDDAQYWVHHLRNWPWHFNARRHWDIMYHTKRTMEIDKEWIGEFAIPKPGYYAPGADGDYTASPSYQRDWHQRSLDNYIADGAGAVHRHDMFLCSKLLEVRSLLTQHPLIQKLREHEKKIFHPFGEGAKYLLAEWIREDEPAFPNYGIYIYWHPYEGYKIGQAENVIRRMAKHECSAPSLELLHVIETANLDWCEQFLHKRFHRQRKYSNHEYFDLNIWDLHWLFSLSILEKPVSISDQLSLLDLL